MKVASLEAIFQTLNNAHARYLVVGGVAVIAHGYVRLTQYLDLVLDLSSESLSRALEALASLAYRPLVPVALSDFARTELRKDWIENRQMKVFNLVSDLHPDVTIDIFPQEPFVFDVEYAVASFREISPSVSAPIVRLETLIALKLQASRPRDLDDVEKLRKLQEE